MKLPRTATIFYWNKSSEPHSPNHSLDLWTLSSGIAGLTECRVSILTLSRKYLGNYSDVPIQAEETPLGRLDGDVL